MQPPPLGRPNSCRPPLAAQVTPQPTQTLITSPGNTPNPRRPPLPSYVPPSSPCKPISSPCVSNGSCSRLPPTRYRSHVQALQPPHLLPKPIQTPISRLQPHWPSNPPPQSCATPPPPDIAESTSYFALLPYSLHFLPPSRPQHNPCLIPTAPMALGLQQEAPPCPPPHCTAGEPCISFTPPQCIAGGALHLPHPPPIALQGQPAVLP